MKSKKWSPIKEILFTYLAVNKVMYWYNTIISMNQSDLEGAGTAALNRLVNQDIILILAVTAFFYFNYQLEKRKLKYSSKIEHTIFYAFGYLIMMVLLFSYYLIMSLIFMMIFNNDFSFVMYIREFIMMLPLLSLGYLVVAVVLEVKIYFKKKGKEATDDTLSINTTEDKLNMLKSLLDTDVLSQEEYEKIKKKLISV
jgi:hypothetical protein